MSLKKEKIKNYERFESNKSIGLSSIQVKKRIEQNLVNYDTSIPTKKIWRIFTSNIFTIFNLLNLILAIALFSVNSYKNLLFILVVFCNTTISIIQEIHSKKMVDKLSILSASKVDVIRDGETKTIKIDEIVLDDIVILNSGSQIVVDCKIIEGNIEVNESLITGEEDNIAKSKGDYILSGSYVVSGKCYARVEHVGEENYVSTMLKGAKKVKKMQSEIMFAINHIIRIATIIIIPLGILLFLKQMSISDNSYKMAIVNTVAAVIGMIPEGLVLLTSTVLAVSVIRLSKKRVLVQKLYCIETLARVDTLCLDKTGTITENKMEINKVIPVNCELKDVEDALNILSNNLDDENQTTLAIKEKYKNNKNKEKADIVIPFDSKKKWSGVSISKKGSYILGSPEFVLKDKLKNFNYIIEKYVNESRILVLASSKQDFKNKELPDEIEPIAFLLFTNKIRKEAYDTLKYFKEQGVELKIISGDNPVTVSNIAKKVGLKNYNKYIDVSTLKTEDDIKKAADEYTVFGRVTPIQKQILVKQIKANGHTVAMTGDGVNDVLALKEADCSIAVASGSDAARNVAQLVLLDSNFDSMPSIVAEGRRTINNIERSSTLFLSKTIYSTLLAILFLLIATPYPFVPIHLTLISIVTIGIPSFVLALEPNKDIVRGRFLPRILEKSLPSAILVVINIAILIVIKNNIIFGINDSQISTLCVIMTGIIGLILLKRLSTPFNKTRFILFTLMIVMFILSVAFIKEIFSLSFVSLNMGIIITILTVISVFIFSFIEKGLNKLFKIRRKYFKKKD